MKKTFEWIAESRGWDEVRKKVLGNMEARLSRRLGEGDELRLTQFQKKAIYDESFWRDWSDGAVPEHLIVQGATSAGKTLLAELNTLDTLQNNKKAVILVPLKAMVHERTRQFREDMCHGSAEYNINVYGSSSDYMENDEKLIRGDYSVAIIVYEKFFAMLNQGRTKIMENCGLLVVDELSMLSLDQRGPKLEMALEIVRNKYADTRIMCLATCDCTTENVSKWLGTEKPIISTARPVALEEHIVRLNGEGIYRMIPKDHETDGEEMPEKLTETIPLPDYRSDMRTDDKRKNLLLAVISDIYRKNEDARVLVFVPKRAEAAAFAEFLYENINKWCRRGAVNADAEFLESLELCDRGEGQDKLIDELIPNGIAYHHAGISTTLRELIEEQFSRPRSCIRVIVATETLTVGVNMPFDAMIMTTNLVPRGGGSEEPLTRQEYRNYIGRAGRLGQSNRVGVTYLFALGPEAQEKYWSSYNKRDEVISSLTKADESVLAPYYLSLLNNKMGGDLTGTNITLDRVEELFERSLAKQCGTRRRINTTLIHENLYGAYMASEKLASGIGRSAVVSRAETFAIEQFGAHMAPYAFSIDTCLKIYEWFYEGYKNKGMPLGITKEDVENDRYLLDILYHVCSHGEIASTSNLNYPDSKSVSRVHGAKIKVLTQLKKITEAEDEAGNKKYSLWVDSFPEKERADVMGRGIWDLLNCSNLADESSKLQAAMRAVILFYWTKGYTLSEIKKETGFATFTEIISGDIERLAEMVSFHLDAVCSCLSTVVEPGTLRSVYEDSEAAKAFYALHTRVKYGMPRDLVVFANKHIHGLDRRRLLDLKKEADKANMEPLQYLYTAPHGKIPERILTPTQLSQLKQSMERRGSVRNIETMVDIITRDVGPDVKEEELEALINIAAHTKDGEETEFAISATAIYKSLRTLIENDALGGVYVDCDFRPELIKWRYGSDVVRIGIVDSVEYSADVDEFLRGESKKEKLLSKILVVPYKFTSDQIKKVKRTYGAHAVFDNVYFALALANTLRLGLDEGYAITEYMGDVRGIYTKYDYTVFPITRYVKRETDADVKGKYYLIQGIFPDSSYSDGIRARDMEAVLSESKGLENYELLPWGRDLLSDDYDFASRPTVIMLKKSDVTGSESLTQFIYRMRNQQFRNCKLLLLTEQDERDWNSGTSDADADNNSWSEQFNKISKSVVNGNVEAVRVIRDFISGWAQTGYLIGISYAHFDSSQSATEDGTKNDVDLIRMLAEELKDIYGEDRILFDGFYPARMLFSANKGAEKSLEAYGTCRYYIVLWNVWTKMNGNCQNELKVILERCKDDSNSCMFLQTGQPTDPLLPDDKYFYQKLSEGNIEGLVEHVRHTVSKLLEK